MNRTTHMNKENVERNWCLLDLDGAVFGRAATVAAKLLIGKHKPVFTPGQDCGDFVIAINADKLKVTGAKLADKRYYRHSGYPGGLTERTLAERLSENPAELFRDAVKRMLPRNRLGRRLITKLKVYAGPNHPHVAQKPVAYEAEQLKRI